MKSRKLDQATHFTAVSLFPPYTMVDVVELSQHREGNFCCNSEVRALKQGLSEGEIPSNYTALPKQRKEVKEEVKILPIIKMRGKKRAAS